MNYRIVIGILRIVLRAEMLFLLVPTGIAIYCGEDAMPFVGCIALLLVVTALLSRVKTHKRTFYLKEGFAATALVWMLLSLFGALPFYFSGYFESFADAFFEAVSGFTTAGATVLGDIESLPRSILFWRSFTQWIGGMGVILFILAVMPNLDSSSVNLLRAESGAPESGKIVPRIKETARIIYLIYFGLTLLLIAMLLVVGLPLFDSLIHAMGTAGTAGFSSLNDSVGGYGSATVEGIITFFTFLFGINFTLYYYLFCRDFKTVFRDEELRLYVAIIVVSIAIIGVDIYKLYGSALTSLRYASFQVVTLITTTGFSSANFDSWPMLSKSILILLMLTGCCAGSTGGGFKLLRILQLSKAAKNEIYSIIHPRVVRTVKINGVRVQDSTIRRGLIVLFTYFCLFMIGNIIVSLEGKDFTTTTTAVIAALSNVGSGLSGVGPTRNFADFNTLSKLFFSFCMLAGRLEFIPLMVLFSPSIWKKPNQT